MIGICYPSVLLTPGVFAKSGPDCRIYEGHGGLRPVTFKVGEDELNQCFKAALFCMGRKEVLKTEVEGSEVQ